MIFGAGPSLRWDMGSMFPGDVIATDITSSSVSRFTNKFPVCIVTLEDGENMKYLFDHDWSDKKPPVIYSHRTKPYLLEFIKMKKFETILFNDPLVPIIWNVGMMAWYYAWKVLGYRKIYLNGFDQFLQEPDNLQYQLWTEPFWEFKKDYAPKDLETYLIPPRMHKFGSDEKEYPGFSNINRYIEYRMKRQEQITRKFLGNEPEHSEPILL